MKGLLLGGAQALRLSPSDPPGGVCSAGIDRMAAAHRAGGARANANGSSALCRGLELKRDAVLALPGLAQLPPYPSELDAGAEQSRLLHMHARLVDELIAESALLAELSRHCADHSIHDVARGLERYFAGLIDSLTLKLQLVAAEMYQALYTPEVVHAIGRLRAILDDKQAALAKEQAALAERLAIYRDAGREFQEIASAYSSVLQETDLIRRDIARVEQL
ncbi:hypothetical protein GGI04_000945 [Coemansia thaxteri]|nr:hypothetical protein GGI04_000945 [Coemansia thaxteri]